jgi:hypothetical protein
VLASNPEMRKINYPTNALSIMRIHSMALSLRGKALELIKIIESTDKCAKKHEESSLAAQLRLIYLLTIGRFSPDEIRAYAPHIKHFRKKYPVLISKQASLHCLQRINSVADAELTEDKHAFYEHCHANSIETPHHLFTTNSADPHFQRIIAGGAIEFVGTMPEHSIAKDRHGAYGSGFTTIQKLPDGVFLLNSSELLSGSALLTWLQDSKRQPLVAQERVFDHPRLAELSGKETLQCVRLVTYKHESGDISYPFFIVKLVTGDNVVDNFSGGRSGNLIAFGDLEKGILSGAVCGNPVGYGLIETHTHPDSGHQISGFEIPHWKHVLDLAKRAHLTIPQQRTIGWDIAITKEKPLIIEGNIWYDPPLYAPHILSMENWISIFGHGMRFL